MEEIHNLVTGFFVPDNTAVAFDDDDSEEDGEDEIPWLGYKEVSKFGAGGRSCVQYARPKYVKGNFIDLHTRHPKRVGGTFHLQGQWWQTTILRTKLSTKSKYKEPKDPHALCYRLRDDVKRFDDNVIHLFISALEGRYEYGDDFRDMRGQFEQYLRNRDLFETLDFSNLEDQLQAFIQSHPKDKQEMPTKFKGMIIQSGMYHEVGVAVQLPSLLHYLPQLFPYHFSNIMQLTMDQLKSLHELLEENPGYLAFKQILSKSCGMLGCETSSEALRRSGLVNKVPQEVQDAILIYEYLKKETKENGHTAVNFNKIMDVLGQVVQMFEEALEFLNTNKVTKTQMEGGYRVVYMMQLWKAENTIAKSLNSLVMRNDLHPWRLQVDWDREDMASIREDVDQFRAAKLIADQPVVAISGKGGCGKTYVVTKVITSAKNVIQPRLPTEDQETQGPDYEEDDPYMCCGDAHVKGQVPERVELLLTAPTGKAANLLGKRAGCPSYTLHQVIFSHRIMLQKDIPWKHKDVNVLVVDECSLVSVATFSYLIQLLLEHAQLRRVVLLGDVRQLPSIEPGNFLEDTFSSLTRIGCGVELRTNHRAESQIIVENATRISKKMIPIFHEEKFMLRKLPEGMPGQNGNDYVNQDTNQEVLRLLNHPALKSDVNSQFISFTRRICESINDLCCNHYSQHRIKDSNRKWDFRKNDKICCTKNGYVNVYEEVHGLMSCKKKKEKPKKDAASTQREEQPTSLEGMDQGVGPVLEEQLPSNGNQVGGMVTEEDAGNGEENNQTRLCNGEIFFILDEVQKKADNGQSQTFFLLTRDPESEPHFWVDRRQLRKVCKIRHAWARTIHTFQGSETDNVVYIVGAPSRYQNWQHVYTAITRGRKTVFILGQEFTMRLAIKRSEIKRQTSLKKQLIERFQKNKNFSATQAAPTTPVSSTQMPSANASLLFPFANKPSAALPSADLSVQEPAIPTNRQKQTQLSLSRRNKNAQHTRFSEVQQGEVSLNNTQMVTDILTSLAEDHEGEEIEEYNSEEENPLPAKSTREDRRIDDEEISSDDSDSQSLLFGIRNGEVTKQKLRSGINHAQDDTRTGGDSEGHDSDMDADSDDSQSLLSPPSASRTTHGHIRTSQEAGPSSAESRNQTVSVSNPVNPDNRAGVVMQEGKIFTQIKNARRDSSLNISGIRNKGNALSDFSPSPVSIRELGYEDNLQRLPFVSKTPSGSLGFGSFHHSSPLDGNMSSDARFHIRTGVSPLTPGFDGYTPDPKTKGNNSSLDSSYIPPTPMEKGNRGLVLGTQISTKDDIMEPKSNESQWSEIDESDLLKMDDCSIFHNKTSDENNFTAKPSCPSKTGLSCPTLVRQVLDTQGNTEAFQRNISTNSMWSDLDDDNYLCLNLEDISNMENTGSSFTKDQNKANPSIHRQNAGILPEIRLTKSPSSPTATDKSSSTMSTPTVSPALKRQLPRDESETPKKLHLLDQGSSVSPLKNYLAKLDFSESDQS